MENNNDLIEIKSIFAETIERINQIDKNILTETLNKIPYSDYSVQFYQTQIKIYHKERSDQYDYLDELSNKVNEEVDIRIANLKQIYLRCSMAFQIWNKKNENNKVSKEEVDNLYNTFYDIQDLAKEKRLELVKNKIRE